MLTSLCRGDVALLSNSNIADSSTPWTINSVWAGGHTGVVRSVLWDENVSFLGVTSFNAYRPHQHEVIVTGGEDSKIITWRCPFPEHSSPSGNPARDEVAMEMDSIVLKRERHDDNMDVCENEPVRMFLSQ
jgi:hypothetical protein